MCIAILADSAYFHKTMRTVRDLRTIGQWTSDIVLMCVDFTPPSIEISKYNLKILPVHYNFSKMYSTVLNDVLRRMYWQKLHIFDPWFHTQYKKVIYLDFGVRILDKLPDLYQLSSSNKALMVPYQDNTFSTSMMIYTTSAKLQKSHYIQLCKHLSDVLALSGVLKDHVEALPEKINDKLLFFSCNHPDERKPCFILQYPLRYEMKNELPAVESKPTIGIAIPCYKPHIPKLIRLLQSIEYQTVKPTQVAISCSSCEPADFPKLPEYSFEVMIVTTRKKQNTAVNRNIASKLLTTDRVSFIDADDLMLPHRLEFIQKAFDGGAQYVVHSFTEKATINMLSPEPRILYDKLDVSSDIHLINKNNSTAPLHHAQVSVTLELARKELFHEDTIHVLNADSDFCLRLFYQNLPNAYIENPLSIYQPSLTCFE